MRKDKQLLLNEIQQKIDASTAMIVTGYQSLSPNTSWKLRDLLAKQGSIFEVVRKRVFLKAAEKAGFALNGSSLGGSIGVVFVNQPDAMGPTKTVTKFSEENGAVVQVLCGQLEGKLISAADLIALSKLPGLDEMRSMLLGLFISPMAQMLSVLDAKVAEQPSDVEKNS
jgi:large subunit ribosomal protein L10